MLERVLKPRAGIQLGSYVEDEGKALFNLTKEKGMEGIIAKRKDSIYRPGKRTSDWVKIKARLQQEFVVGGFTAPKGSRKHLGAVVLGAYTNGELRHYGYAGSGFSEKGLKDAVEKMKPLLTEKCPFVNPPNIKEKIQWVRPKLVCEVEYAEFTADDQLRQTTFLGWRDDKKAKEVVLEPHRSLKRTATSAYILYSFAPTLVASKRATVPMPRAERLTLREYLTPLLGGG